METARTPPDRSRDRDDPDRKEYIMAEYVIFTDAGGDVPAELWTKYGLGSVPMSYLLSGETSIFDPGDP